MAKKKILNKLYKNISALTKRDIKSYLQLSSSRILNILKLSPYIFVLPSVVIYPTSSCNYDCIMCEYAKSKRKNHKIMELSLMKKTINECSRFLFKPKPHFSGVGEPLVYSEIKKAMQLCKQKRMKWSMTTNGYLLEKYAEDIVKNNCNAINTSIHGDEFENRRITRVKDSFERTVRGIKKLNIIKKKLGKKKPLVAINCVINNKNVQNLKSILNMFMKLPINSVTFQHLVFYENNLKNNEDFLITKKDKLSKLTEFVDFIENNKFPVKIHFFPKIKRKDIIGYYTNKNYPFNMSCVLPWLTVRIHPNGDVKLNCSTIFGNLKTESLKSIINNKEALKFRNLIKKRKFKAPVCFRCCHRQYY